MATLAALHTWSFTQPCAVGPSSRYPASFSGQRGDRRHREPLSWTGLDHPGVRKVRTDRGFAGRPVEWTAPILGRELEIVRKTPDQRGFQVQPKRWAVGGGAHLLVVHFPPPPRPGLRDQPCPFGDDDPLGDDRHHGPPPHPRPTGNPTRPTAALSHRCLLAQPPYGRRLSAHFMNAITSGSDAGAM
jgi:hypothetical protein